MPHWSDCATNNTSTPELLGACDCGNNAPACEDCKHWRDDDTCRVNLGVVRAQDDLCSLFLKKEEQK